MLLWEWMTDVSDTISLRASSQALRVILEELDRAGNYVAAAYLAMAIDSLDVSDAPEEIIEIAPMTYQV